MSSVRGCWLLESVSVWISFFKSHACSHGWALPPPPSNLPIFWNWPPPCRTVPGPGLIRDLPYHPAVEIAQPRLSEIMFPFEYRTIGLTLIDHSANLILQSARSKVKSSRDYAFFPARFPKVTGSDPVSSLQFLPIHRTAS